MKCPRLFRSQAMIVCALIASSCTTVSTTMDEVVQKSSVPFSECDIKEGGGDITVFNNGAMVFSSRYDWISSGTNSFQIELADAMGRTQAGIEFLGDAGLAATYGPSALAELSIGQNENGSITFEQTATNISLADLRCHLNGKVPARAFRSANRIEPWFGSHYYSGSISKGDIYLFPNADGNGGYCVSYCWDRRFLFFGVCADFCRVSKSDRKVKLSIGNYSAEFNDEDLGGM